MIARASQFDAMGNAEPLEGLANRDVLQRVRSSIPPPPGPEAGLMMTTVSLIFRLSVQPAKLHHMIR